MLRRRKEGCGEWTETRIIQSTTPPGGSAPQTASGNQARRGLSIRAPARPRNNRSGPHPPRPVASRARSTARCPSRHADATLRHCPRCNMKLWPRPLKSKMRFHDLRHTAATLMLRAGVDPHRVQRVLRHASVTTTTGTYAHLAIEDLRDAVSKIGSQQSSERSPFADRLRTSLNNGSAANGDACPKVPENAALDGAPGRSRTCGPRLRRPLLYPAELQARALLVPPARGRVKQLRSP